jgi:hypothetical protein
MTEPEPPISGAMSGGDCDAAHLAVVLLMLAAVGVCPGAAWRQFDLRALDFRYAESSDGNYYVSVH